MRPGEEITVHAVVTQKHYMAKKEDNFVVLDVWCENQDKTKVSVGKASAVIPHEHGGSDAKPCGFESRFPLQNAHNI